MNEKTMSEYKFPTTGGGFTGVLKFKKKLNGKPCLLCYFLSDKGEKIVLPLWENSKTKRYTPIETNDCFLTEVTENTKWHCKFEVTKTSNGNTNTKFLSAFLTKNSSENNDFFAKKFFFLMIKKAFPRCFVADLFVENLSFSNEKIFTCRDKNCSFRYEICKELNGNWQIKRTKLNDKKERDAIIIIDNVSFDVVSKNYI